MINDLKNKNINNKLLMFDLDGYTNGAALGAGGGGQGQAVGGLYGTDGRRMEGSAGGQSVAPAAMAGENFYYYPGGFYGGAAGSSETNPDGLPGRTIDDGYFVDWNPAVGGGGGGGGCTGTIEAVYDPGPPFASYDYTYYHSGDGGEGGWPGGGGGGGGGGYLKEVPDIWAGTVMAEVEPGTGGIGANGAVIIEWW